MQECHR